MILYCNIAKKTPGFVYPGVFLSISLAVFVETCYNFGMKYIERGLLLNIFPFTDSLTEAQAYMHIAGYPDFTHRELKDLKRIMHGYMPVDVYVRQMTRKYFNMHGLAGRDNLPAAIPENLIKTRDPAILHVFERKVYPARLVSEFRFGPIVTCSAEDFIDLNGRICGDIYPDAGSVRSDINFNELACIFQSHGTGLKSCEQDLWGLCERFERLIAELLSLNVFEHGNLFTCMAFTAKLAYFWGKTCRFIDSDAPGCITFKFSDRKQACTGLVRVA